MLNPKEHSAAATARSAANNDADHPPSKTIGSPPLSNNPPDTERRSREDENGGWLARNIHALLAIAIMFITFAMFVFVIHSSMDATFKGSDAKDIVIYILGALTTVATQVVSYYFGSSSSSVDKNKTLSAIAKRGG